MFDMFKGMGQLAGLMRNLPKLQEEMAQMQERLAQVSAEGDAGAGMVKVKVNGKFDLISCTLSDEALKLNDREMLEDLIKAAVNQAMARAREAIQQETARLASGLGLPPGLQLPGLG
ncbi:MAG: YbaB/EbfC family nucleoid-associated protein [Gemmataceae bacterium]